MKRVLIGAALLLALQAALAGKADVLGVQSYCSPDRICRFVVSVEHTDDGWNHYVDMWEVLTPHGEVLGVRELAHPHNNEQPFTRSLDGVKIPEGISEVMVRARDSKHGYGGVVFTADIPL